ncbi:octanoyl-[GcvH]:protein N-octanoyltransferase [Evansella caseinilytica]|uniref:Octanoyl-[GcvH]:protein N-octanoyltransferase n=1 Tax=Evansella caseinilytica TaxID=1503961 RepID=A0A1H3V4G9_9BACI|nr:biotin/lipoate A/B protein ligase family protein [Evansella caseinilytica]SDZ68945.1 octanoyl-[GcvH]:protein N-octanoyltransferase [Evansella caseinilytica]
MHEHEPLHSPLYRKQWYYLDHSDAGLTMNPIHSFAMDDTLCRKIAAEPDWGIARSWVHHSTVVLGIQDSRLPHVEDGISFLRQQGYHVIVRNSGGLAVVLDKDILNLSLIFKEDKGMSIDHGYELMVAMMKRILPFGEKIEDGEIKESYCPGRYDLSINGKKFAGISQRRLRGGVAVQIYLAVSGSGAQRAELIRQFYEHAVQGETIKFNYPKIVPAKMAAIAELTGSSFSVQEVLHSLLFALRALSSELHTCQLSAADWEQFAENVARMEKRNEKLLL